MWVCQESKIATATTTTTANAPLLLQHSASHVWLNRWGEEKQKKKRKCRFFVIFVSGTFLLAHVPAGIRLRRPVSCCSSSSFSGFDFSRHANRRTCLAKARPLSSERTFFPPVRPCRSPIRLRFFFEKRSPFRRQPFNASEQARSGELTCCCFQFGCHSSPDLRPRHSGTGQVAMT